MENKENTGQFFLSNLSHEIRNPLNGIAGYLQLLSSTRLDNNQLNYVNNMNRCCIQLVELVNDILDFSKLASGKVIVNTSFFSLKEVWSDIDSALGNRIREKNQTLRYIDDNIPEYIITDKNRLTQILINLISNANKFTPQNGIIYVSCEIEEDNTLKFSVEDNGIGISPEEQKKLFTPFEQVQQTLIKNGAGLGLAITKKLVELLGGEIKVQSKKNEGSIFTFTIKFENKDKFEKKFEKKLSILKDKYVLIIEDNIDDRLCLSEIFFDYEMKPILASSKKEALRFLKKYPFSIIISSSSFGQFLEQNETDIPIVYVSENNSKNNNISNPVNKIKLLDLIYENLNKNDISKYELNETVEEPEKILQKDIKILVAEDVSYNLQMMVKMLNNLGYNKVWTAIDGEEAVEKIDTESSYFHILLLDLKMPKKDGMEVAEYIQAKGLKYPKIVVVSGSVLDSDKERCKKAGIKYFLPKPFNMVHLKNILNNVLSGSGF
jgi:CheY-like chemotaxis protein/anti-sigma regulatory factor (Ser/Thr protein kinase)